MLDRTNTYTSAPEASTEPTIPVAVLDLVTAFERATPAELSQAAKLIGVAVLWDAMIAPATD